MIHKTNLQSPSPMMGHSFFEKHPVIADVGTVITSIAAGALIGAAVAFVASTPIGLTISLGAATGGLISIAIVAFRRFHHGMTANNLPEVKSGVLPNSDNAFLRIASNLDFDDFKAFSEVSRGCNKMVSFVNGQRKKAVEEVAFGKEQWLKYWGVKDDVEPTLPRDIIEVLARPDPEDPTKKIQQTHTLTLILRNQTAQSVLELRAQGSGNFFSVASAQLAKPNDKSYWALKRRGVLGGDDLVHGTRGKSKMEHNNIFAKLSEDGKAHYSLPTTLEGAASILAHEARFGERLFGDNPLTYMRCQETVGSFSVVIGGFASDGPDVSYGSIEKEIGASGVWRWRPVEVPTGDRALLPLVQAWGENSDI
jgi:hypothetical protein